MKQRVPIARALTNDPEVMLPDEPFASLDAMTRQVLQEQLAKIYEKHKKTIICITHSIDEALHLSSRIIIMTARPGSIKAPHFGNRKESIPATGASIIGSLIIPRRPAFRIICLDCPGGVVYIFLIETFSVESLFVLLLSMLFLTFNLEVRRVTP